MRVGCPKEIKVQEYRVGLTLDAVREYVARGHKVLVETGAGTRIGATDHLDQSERPARMALRFLMLLRSPRLGAGDVEKTRG